MQESVDHLVTRQNALLQGRQPASQVLELAKGVRKHRPAYQVLELAKEVHHLESALDTVRHRAEKAGAAMESLRQEVGVSIANMQDQLRDNIDTAYNSLYHTFQDSLKKQQQQDQLQAQKMQRLSQQLAQFEERQVEFETRLRRDNATQLQSSLADFQDRLQLEIERSNKGVREQISQLQKVMQQTMLQTQQQVLEATRPLLQGQAETVHAAAAYGPSQGDGNLKSGHQPKNIKRERSDDLHLERESRHDRFLDRVPDQEEDVHRYRQPGGSQRHRRHDLRAEEQEEPKPREPNRRIANLPKLEPYKGDYAWKDFASKVRTLSRLAQWQEEELVDRLQLHLSGTALHYFEQLAPGVRNNFDKAMEAMNRRFGQKLPIEAQKAAFRNLKQKEEESLRDYADRVRETAIEAFPGWEAEIVEAGVITAFLRGMTAHEAAMHGFTANYKNLEDAILGVQVYLEHHRSVYGSTRKARRVEVLSSDEDDEEIPAVHRAQQPWVKPRDSAKSSPSPVKQDRPASGREDLVKRLEDAMQRTMKEGFEQMTSAIKSLQIGQRVRGDGNFRQQNRSRSPSPRDRSRDTCNKCQQVGHWARDCKNQQQQQPAQQPTRVQFDLNSRENP
jgi:hypothetical protein